MADVNTTANGSIAVGGTAQLVIAADSRRRSIQIQNAADERMWFGFDPTAVFAVTPNLVVAADGSAGWFLDPGATREVSYRDWPETSAALYAVSDTAGSKYATRSFSR
jgi:hypothetical protein